MSEQATAVSFDTQCRALEHVDRRRLLLALYDGDSRGDLSLDDGELDLDGAGRDASLYHVHLPMLEELGFVEWDREARRARRGPRFDELEPLLEFVREHRIE